MLIDRNIQAKALELGEQFPVLGVVGPRQTGKTT